MDVTMLLTMDTKKTRLIQEYGTASLCGTTLSGLDTTVNLFKFSNIHLAYAHHSHTGD